MTLRREVVIGFEDVGVVRLFRVIYVYCLIFIVVFFVLYVVVGFRIGESFLEGRRI